MRRDLVLGFGCVVGVAWGAWAVAGSAEEMAPEEPAAAAVAAVEVTGAASNPEDNLTGEQIYESVLENRFYSYVQELVMESGDRATNVQKTELGLRYLSFRGQEEGDRFLSKSIAKYTKPQDVRHLGYLVIKKPGGEEDQFIYRPSARRVRRINLRGEAVFGTDFSMEDILPREIEDATYQRFPDGEVGGVPVFAVEVVPLPEKDSEYSKFIVYVEKEHYVTIRTHYWDTNDVKTKELNARIDSIVVYEGTERDGTPKQIWVPTESRITQLKTGSYTNLLVTRLELDRKLRDSDFSQRKLTASR
jgi:hypothetical protein